MIIWNFYDSLRFSYRLVLIYVYHVLRHGLEPEPVEGKS